MKRSPMPPPSAPLERRTRMEPGPGPVRRTGLSPVSAKRRAQRPAMDACRAAVVERARGRCETWSGRFATQELTQAEADVLWSGCTQVGTDWHHLAGRVGDALVDPERSVLLCHPCHDWVERNRAAGYRCGLLLRRNGTTS